MYISIACGAQYNVPKWCHNDLNVALRRGLSENDHEFPLASDGELLHLGRSLTHNHMSLWHLKIPLLKSLVKIKATEAEKIFLRIADSYHAKIAKICNFWTSWPVFQLIYHLFKIRQKAFLPNAP